MKKREWITVVSPGLRLSQLRPLSAQMDQIVNKVSRERRPDDVWVGRALDYDFAVGGYRLRFADEGRTWAFGRLHEHLEAGRALLAAYALTKSKRAA